MFTSAYIFIFLKVLNVYIIDVLPYPCIPYGKWKYRTRQVEHVQSAERKKCIQLTISRPRGKLFYTSVKIFHSFHHAYVTFMLVSLPIML